MEKEPDGVRLCFTRKIINFIQVVHDLTMVCLPVFVTKEQNKLKKINLISSQLKERANILTLPHNICQNCQKV